MIKEELLINSLERKEIAKAPTLAIPSTSGDFLRSIKTNTPTADAELTNKKYVDDSVTALTTTDHSSADTVYVPGVLYNTDATPPAANTVPIGTIYVQYTP